MPPSRSLKRLPGRGANKFISDLPGIEVIRTWNYQFENTQISQEIASLINKIPSQIDYQTLFFEKSSYQERLSLLLLLLILHRVEQDHYPSKRTVTKASYHVSQIRTKIVNTLIVILRNDVRGSWPDRETLLLNQFLPTKTFDKVTLKRVLGASPTLSTNKWTKLANRVKISDTTTMMSKDIPIEVNKKSEEQQPLPPPHNNNNNDTIEFDYLGFLQKEILEVSKNNHEVLGSEIEFSSSLSIQPPPTNDFIDFSQFFHKSSKTHQFIHPLSSLNPKWSQLTVNNLPGFLLYQQEYFHPPGKRSLKKARYLRKTLLKNKFKLAFQNYQKLASE